MAAANTGGGAVLGQVKATQLVATMAVGVALVTGGCQTDREVTRPDPEPVTDELLTSELLTQDDVPSPYTLAEDAEPVGPELVPEHECDDRLKELDPEETATATFTAPSLGATLTNTISYYPGQGANVGDVYNDLLEDCQQVVVDDAGVSFTMNPLDFGVLSDDTLPLRVELEYDDGSIQQRNLIIMRAGDIISTIRLDSPRPSDLEVLDQATRVAIGNLGELDQAVNP
jgi:hypothetical protein